jgi:hypothetical protein
LLQNQSAARPADGWTAEPAAAPTRPPGFRAGLSQINIAIAVACSLQAMTQPSQTFRHRAFSAELAARNAPAASLRKEWEQIAIEWHALASIEDVGREMNDLLVVETLESQPT